MATSSFFYGGSSPPDQNTVDELIDTLNAKVTAVDEDRIAAEQAKVAAEQAASNAAISETNTAGLASQSASTLAEAQDAVTEANAAVSTTNTNAATATTKAAEATAAATAAALSEDAAALSETNAASSATSASTSASTATTQASAAGTSATNAASSATSAASSATTATTQASNASTSASAAAGSASSAATSASNASTSASGASTSASAAATSATNASTSATAASGSATTASTAATAAQAAQTAAEAVYDNFDDRYLGSKTSAPTVDNDGNTLLTGALYFNSTTSQMNVWSGTAWGSVGSGGGGAGDVAGPASSTDNAIARFDGTTGKLVQNSLVTIDDTGKANFNNVAYVYGMGLGISGLSVNDKIVLGGTDSGDFSTYLASDSSLGWSSSTGVNAAISDLRLYRDSTDILAQRRSTNPQTFRLYNTYTDASNYERGFLKWASGRLEIGTDFAGTGSAKPLRVSAPSSYAVVAAGSSGVYLETNLTNRALFADGGLQVRSDYQAKWSSDAAVDGTMDTGLSRDSAGVLKITNGSTGLGSLKVLAIDISRTAVTSPVAADGNVFSGTYTPTLTNTTNIAASTAYVCQYMRVGNVVTVSGRVAINPTAVGVIQMELTLPIASNIASNCYGTFASAFGDCGYVASDNTGDRARFLATIADEANREYGFTFTYVVV